MDAAERKPLDLFDARAGDRMRTGGKASALAILGARGLPVPDALVIPWQTFHHFLQTRGLWQSARSYFHGGDPDRAPPLRSAISTASLPGALKADLLRRTQRLGPLLAVRSSGIDEDSENASYAGIFHSELAVRPGDHLERAILSCWAAVFHPRVAAYRGRNNRTLVPRIAVIIQRLVRARVAGVLFTMNPMNGSWREITVEAVWGMGESLVAGQVVPDHFLVARPRRLPAPIQRLAARIHLDIVQKSSGFQDRQLSVGPRGLAWEPVPQNMLRTPKLSSGDVLALCRLALKAEAIRRQAQDLEWAQDSAGRFVLLQARPITTRATSMRPSNILWTRRFIGERWSEPASPLGWSLVEPMLDSFISYPRTSRRYLGAAEALRLVEGAPYINATVFRHLAFKLPGYPPPRFMMDMLPPHEERAWMSRFATPPDLAVYASILNETFRERRWRRFRWNPLTNHLAWDQLEKRLDKVLPTLLPTPGIAPAEALEKAAAGMDLAREYVKVHVTSLLFANILYQVVDGLMRLWLGTEGSSLSVRILRSPEGNMTVETNHQLWRLARLSQRLGISLDDPPDPGTQFGEALATFLRQHGHRSDASWEIMSPCWADNPERVLSMLRRYLDSPETMDPARLASEQARAAESGIERLKEILDRQEKQRLGRQWRKILLMYLIPLTRKYILLRENQRYHFDRLLFTVKKNFLSIGERLCEQGLLGHPGEIRFLRIDEITCLSNGTLAPSRALELIAERRSRQTRLSSISPPDFIVDDKPLPTEPDSGHRLVGQGASPGISRGKARIIHTIDTAQRLEKGEILVTRATDPGWTPLFLVAGGLVLEMGGQLSHGAVVAREYSLPAVVNIRSATKLLETGQDLMVDGTRGLVWILD